MGGTPRLNIEFPYHDKIASWEGIEADTRISNDYDLNSILHLKIFTFSTFFLNNKYN